MDYQDLIRESSTPDPDMLEEEGIREMRVPEHLTPLPLCLFCGAGQYLGHYIYQGVYVAYVYCEICRACGPWQAGKDQMTVLDAAVEAYKVFEGGASDAKLTLDKDPSSVV